MFSDCGLQGQRDRVPNCEPQRRSFCSLSSEEYRVSKTLGPEATPTLCSLSIPSRTSDPTGCNQAERRTLSHHGEVDRRSTRAAPFNSAPKENYLPTKNVTETFMQTFAQLNSKHRATFPIQIGNKFQTSNLAKQIVSDRLRLAGYHLRNGDFLIQNGQNRTSISRYYYCMYHAGRAVCYGYHLGDDYQQHSILPKNLPSNLPQQTSWSRSLNEARLLRNEADYDLYPDSDGRWKADATNLGVTAAEFLIECETFAINEGLI